MSIDENKLENDLAVDGISEDAEELENELVEDQQVEEQRVTSNFCCTKLGHKLPTSCQTMMVHT